MHYILFYEFAIDYLERRGEYRDQHISLAKASHDRGEFFLGGAFAEPTDGAVIVFKGNSPKVAQSFAMEDPYVINGLVASWYVREWTTVVGKDAENPLVS